MWAIHTEWPTSGIENYLSKYIPCFDSIKKPVWNITGTVYDFHGKCLTALNMDVNDSKSFACITNANGVYAFKSLPADSAYYIEAYESLQICKDIDIKDIILIQQHILGNHKFSHAFQYAAADVDNNHRITPADWRYIKNAMLSDDITAWNFAQQRKLVLKTAKVHYASVDKKNAFGTYCVPKLAAHKQIDFIGIQSGNVDFSYSNEQLLDLKQTPLLFLQEETNKKQHWNETQLAFQQDIAITGIQIELELKLPQRYLNTVRVTSDVLLCLDESLHLNTKTGILRIICHSGIPVSIKAGDALCNIRWNAPKAIFPVCAVSESRMEARLYNYKLELSALRIDSRDVKSSERSFNVEDPFPNPFKNEFYVPIELKTSNTLMLQVLDVAGRLVSLEYYQFQAGRHWLRLTDGIIKKAGNYTIIISDAHFMVQKRLIKLN